jgi:uncharacterized peroxidase-related enzyme
MQEIKPIVHMVTDDEIKGEAKKLFDQVRQSTKKVPSWMRVMANCEDTLVGFFTLFKSIMDDAPTDKLLKWKIAYVVSEINKCDFCVSITKMQLKNFGISEDDILNIERDLSLKDRVAIDYAKATALCAYKIEPKILENLKDNFSDEQIVEITSVVGLFSYINRFNDALGILPEAD